MSPGIPHKLPRHVFNSTLYKSILSLWFGTLPTSALKPSQAAMSQWFGLGASAADLKAFDASCQRVCHDALSAISPSHFVLETTKSAAEEREEAHMVAAPFARSIAAEPAGEARDDAALAFALLLDQMPRNIFREDQKLIYSHYDRLARALTYWMVGVAGPSRNSEAVEELQVINGLARRAWWADKPVRRMWSLIPLMHSEHLEDHNEISRSLLEMQNDNEGDVAEYVDHTVGYEKKHRLIIERFGRYPHRNHALGREMTAEEKKFLDDGGDSFGTG